MSVTSEIKNPMIYVSTPSLCVRVLICVRDEFRLLLTLDLHNYPILNHSGFNCANINWALTVACVLKTHATIITVSVTRLCSPLGLELIVKLRTLLILFTFILNAEARD